MNNSRLFRLSRIVIALTAASGMMVNTANAKEEAKAATQYTQQVNQNYAKSLPFSDRQDFDDAQRGFIAPLLDEGILRDANGKVYYRADDYKFDINAAAPETVNPSLWRQSQINGISGLFKVTDKMYQVRGQDISKEGANKQVISSQADSLIKISRIWADFFPANTSNQPI
ncbi:hypothetical protein OFO77_19655, partial [Escherichia coli]|nr:hypothetical protein [Escherichia coli]MED8157200.1 hypothetical protein [Escherichia coli]